MDCGISILGSTGSVGRQSLDVIEKLGLKVSSLTAHKNVGLLEEQTRRFRPELVAVFDERSAEELRVRLADMPVRIAMGEQGLLEAATLPSAGTVLTAVVGTVGLLPTMAAISEKKRIALANKETLVCAGRLVMEAAKHHGAEILPVDSEHSAIFQCLRGNDRMQVRRLLLTASGGPFRGKSYAELTKMTRAQALRHPNWSMGDKITIDSATLMNKGLEYIEAMHLFGVRPEQIEVLVHPQSIIHSMVQYEDNSVIAQMGLPDMRLPIQYALTYPERRAAVVPETDFTKLAGLCFEKPDTDAFRCLALAMETAKLPGTACAVMNAANEEAVGLFLKEKIGFCDIYELVNSAVRELHRGEADSIETVLEADREARQFIKGKAAIRS